jgi:Tfp pilus assembly protein PilZ
VFVPKKAVARLAIIGVHEPDQTILRDCFRTFSISSVVVEGDAAQRMQKEKFEACVLPLDDDAGALLEAIRNSASNRRVVIYGIGGAPQQIIRFSKYGINATFDTPLDRQAALKVVRATHLLVLNELRRYVRIPLVTEIQVEAGTDRGRATMMEISAGGMSVKSDFKLQLGHSVIFSFSLPENGPKVRVRGSVCWARDNENIFGFRYDANDENRLTVKEWIDRYLDL